MYIFNYVMGDWTIEASPVPFERIKHKNILVFIGPPECVDGITKAAQSGKWSSRASTNRIPSPDRDCLSFHADIP